MRRTGFTSIGNTNMIYERTASNLTLPNATDTIHLDGSTASLGAPFVAFASGERMLSQTAAGQAFTSAAVELGDPTSAAIDFPAWDTLTTRTDLVVDDTDPDAGAHYDPARPVVVTFTDDGSDLSWTTLGADECSLDGADAATSGSAPLTGRHVLRCTGPGGDTVAVH